MECHVPNQIVVVANLPSSTFWPAWLGHVNWNVGLSITCNEPSCGSHGGQIMIHQFSSLLYLGMSIGLKFPKKRSTEPAAGLRDLVDTSDSVQFRYHQLVEQDTLAYSWTTTPVESLCTQSGWSLRGRHVIFIMKN